jgi:predicted RNA-binding Zn ribbon-like protein
MTAPKIYVPNDTANGAPGRLEAVRAFLNTVDLEAAARGAAVDDLGGWCTSSGLCPDAGEAALADLRAFREALRDLVEANGGEGDPGERWRAMEPYAARAGYGLRISPSGVPVLEPQGKGADAAIAAILAIVYDAVADGTWARLKACRKESCRWAFYDLSKNGSGAWCNMRVCGNRVKAARRRAREKSQKSREK